MLLTPGLHARALSGRKITTTIHLSLKTKQRSIPCLLVCLLGWLSTEHLTHRLLSSTTEIQEPRLWKAQNCRYRLKGPPRASCTYTTSFPKPIRTQASLTKRLEQIICGGGQCRYRQKLAPTKGCVGVTTHAA